MTWSDQNHRESRQSDLWCVKHIVRQEPRFLPRFSCFLYRIAPYGRGDFKFSSASYKNLFTTNPTYCKSGQKFSSLFEIFSVGFSEP